MIARRASSAVLGRRTALGRFALFALVACIDACTGPGAQAPVADALPMHLTPLVDVVPAAHLQWLVDVRPKSLMSDGVLGPALAAVIPPERFASFAHAHGGIDLRVTPELVVAGYSTATLALVRTALVPERVESAYRERGFELARDGSNRGVGRLEGHAGGKRAQVVVFGHEGAGQEIGERGALDAAVYFAEGRLRHAAPALHAEPLATVVAQMGDWAVGSPLRAFAAGPFEGPWSGALGGLLGAATGVGASLTPLAPTDDRKGARVVLTVVLTGTWEAAGASEEAGGRASAIRDREGSLGADVGLHRAADASPPGLAPSAPAASAHSSPGEIRSSRPGRSPHPWPAQAAAQRLAAAFELLAEDPLGRLCGLDRPLDPPRVEGDRDALRFEVTLDAAALARGLKAVASADFGL